MSGEIAAIVVDDSPALRRELRDLVLGLGLACDEAEDGASAWRRLVATRYDLILTDLHMPALDGLKLIGLVRAGGANRDTPIVVVSAEGTPAERERALGLGASAWLAKPARADEIAALVRDLVGG